MNIKLLKQKDFSLLIMGKLVSLVGTNMQNFALSLYVLKITGSATKFASVLAVTLIPELILGPVAGVFADWFDRKKIIVYLDMLSGIIVGIFAVIFKINGGLSLGYIYILVILLSMASLLLQPAVNTVIPSIIKKDELVDANSIVTVIMRLGNLLAPAIAGVLFGFYGLLVILIVNSISFIVSSISEMFINIPKSNKKPEKINVKAFFGDFSEGISFIKNKEIMLSIMILCLLINLAADATFSVGLTYVCKEIFKITDYQYGFFESILVVPMIMSPFICSMVSKKIKLGKQLFLGYIIASILIGIIAVIASPFYTNLFTGNFIPYISLIIITSLCILISGVANIAMFTIIQKETPLSLMGRVMTVMTTGGMATIPLGKMIFGLLLDNIEAWMCIGLSAVLLFMVIIILRKKLSFDEKCDDDEEKLETLQDIDLSHES
ncbi:enterobactin exporter EntS [Clostridium tepidiprofundi DSM 19306]|uniref:Enterobactin exporter EntS n=1 Tax=Clostridium tepidiprofundi DSM 19306 TaxID=1121338 RepID=A0A151B6Q0_9CLOT|nr:MFS transporter [Clostridium tepidiprofundi]KYH35576.1 enterobactin exporter EntS [Clostridium tepidiprofundi DSM 19306]